MTPDAKAGAGQPPARPAPSAQDRHRQLVTFNDTAVDLPDRRVHELVAERAAAVPEALALVHSDDRWTYRELDERANRTAWALLALGLGREDAVAVATDRTAPWAAAVLGVLKAGGAYLPVEPSHPADRITHMLRASRTRLVVVQAGGTPAVREAAQRVGARLLDVDDVAAGDHPTADPGVRVDADQLAYVFFTSGSTGVPKGALCEHGGMLNHVQAKIGDLGMTPADVLVQNGPQTFDVVVWQLLAALTLGGTTVIAPNTTVQDPQRFVELLATERVSVLQVVPSYLEVLLDPMRAASPGPDSLRILSATGEALKRSLLERWFAAFPDVPVLNTYGLTELSDDVVHVLLREVPDGRLVPMGRPIRNTRAYVLDDDLELLPIGETGQLAFSGTCVGRGYLDDPELTGKVLRDNPFEPGTPLWLTGDHGYWLPTGELVFAGRDDEQVKIRGMRLDIGEVEARILAEPGVRETAVVAARRPNGVTALAAFVVGPGVDVQRVRAGLTESLPDYMVPERLTRIDAIPCTANGKVDKSTLTAHAESALAPVVWRRERARPSRPARERPGTPSPVTTDGASRRGRSSSTE